MLLRPCKRKKFPLFYPITQTALFTPEAISIVFIYYFILKPPVQNVYIVNKWCCYKH